jgi:hypothetical protein
MRHPADATVLPQVFGNAWETCRCDFLWQEPKWDQLVDWWHPDLRAGMVYFDSWDELKGMIDNSTGEAQPGLVKRCKAAKEASAKIMVKERERTLAAYRQLLLRVAQGGGKNWQRRLRRLLG